MSVATQRRQAAASTANNLLEATLPAGQNTANDELIDSWDLKEFISEQCDGWIPELRNNAVSGKPFIVFVIKGRQQAECVYFSSASSRPDKLAGMAATFRVYEMYRKEDETSYWVLSDAAGESPVTTDMSALD